MIATWKAIIGVLIAAGAVLIPSPQKDVVVEETIGVEQLAGTGQLWKLTGNKVEPIVEAWDIEFNGELLPDGMTCGIGEILKRTGADNWDCAADDSGSAGVASDGLDFDEFVDAMTLDAPTTIDTTAGLDITPSISFASGMANIGYYENPDTAYNALNLDSEAWVIGRGATGFMWSDGTDMQITGPGGFDFSFPSGYVTFTGGQAIELSTPYTLMGGDASVSGNFELDAASTFQGSGLADCDGDVQTLGWDSTTRLFTCGDDDTGAGGVASNSLDFDEFEDALNLDADTTITGGVFALTMDHASVSQNLEVVGFASISNANYFDIYRSYIGNPGDGYVVALDGSYIYAGFDGPIEMFTIDTAGSDSVFSAAGASISGNFEVSNSDKFTVKGATGDTVIAGTLNLTGLGTFGAMTATGVIDFGGATSFEIPNGASPTVDAIGELAFDTTDNQIIIASATTQGPLVIPTNHKIWSATIASSSIEFVSGGRIPLPTLRDGVKMTEIWCSTDAATSVIINVSNLAGTADTETVTCDSDGASDTAIGTNPTVAAGVQQSVEIGTVTGTMDYLTFTVYGTYTRE